MSVLTLEAKLERQDPSTPWGFRMQGGKDFNTPLAIQRVNPSSLADKCGLLQGDIILKIGNVSVETLKHKDAQDTILSYGNKLDLLLHSREDACELCHSSIVTGNNRLDCAFYRNCSEGVPCAICVHWTLRKWNSLRIVLDEVKKVNQS